MKKLLISLSILSLFIIACQGDLTDLNEDTKNPQVVPSGTLFANATVSLFDFMASTNVNVNNLRLWAQHWTETTYTDESNYELNERDVNGYTWDILYATVERDIRDARQFMEANQNINAEQKRNRGAIFTVMEVFAQHLLVDFFGDVPYSAAFGDDVTPAYDNAQEIYVDIINRLNGAIANLDGVSGLGADDLIYGGDVTAWKKAANTLKLRLAMRLADLGTVDGLSAQTLAEEAVASGVFTSTADDMVLTYTSSTPHTNPLWVDLVQSGRNDFVAANSLTGYLNSLNDPRADNYFDPPYDSLGNPIGGIVGAQNSYPDYSHPPARIKEPSYPHRILSYIEAEFLLADAAERGYAVGGTAEEHYNAGVTESILFWDGTQQEADDYLAQPEVAYANGDWRERIGTQKWIAMYNRGFEAWSSWRMYDQPALNEAAEINMTPPYRYSYPVTEYSLNGQNVDAAAAKYNGDDRWVRLFWDVN